MFGLDKWNDDDFDGGAIHARRKFKTLKDYKQFLKKQWKIYGKKQIIREKKRKEQQKNLLTHIYNFSPARLKNRTWQKSLGKDKKKKKL